MHFSDESQQPDASQSFLDAVRQLQLTARRSGQRRVLLLAGSRDWCIRSASRALDTLPLSDTHWFSDAAPAGAASSHGGAALRLLGTEFDALVFDAWSGFDPDAFGALSGTVRAGGLLLLLIPPLREWPNIPDPQNARVTVEPHSPEQLSTRYIKRLAGILATDPDLLHIEEGKSISMQATRPEPMAVSEEPVEAPYRTADQKRAVEAVRHVVTGHRRRPVVLTADRGRGKSAAFGIAAAQLISGGCRKVLVTGPGQESVQAVLDHARAMLPGELHAAIEFVPPDVLVRAPQAVDLLLVDEAAALPTPMLLALLKQYARIAFATTVHGYEGTGRGFALRFARMLDQHANSWRTIPMSTPIRWAPGDPLERLTFRLLLLDASAAPDHSFAQADYSDYTIEQLDRDRLLNDPDCLDELFGLLVLAHYRTRPLDLRHLLDGPNLSIHVLKLAGHVAGVVLLAEEGELEVSKNEAICAGISRPHGHLLPETLAAHQGLCEALQLKAMRIVRIAVHPAAQRHGLGTQLVRYVAETSRKAGHDYFGSSFGATYDVLHFWHRSGAATVRVGFQRGATSGCHSVLILYPVSLAGNELHARARAHFSGNFPHQLSDSLKDMDVDLVMELFGNADAAGLQPDEADWQDARSFAFGRRELETSIGALWRVTCFASTDKACISRLKPEEITLLVARVLQRHSWQHCAGLIAAKGRAEALKVLRRAVGQLISYYSRDE